MSSEEDVFGHGGQLEQNPPGNVEADMASAAAAPSSMRLCAATTTAGEDGRGIVDGPSERPAKSARRNKEHRMCEERDYVAEAVSRLGSSLKRKDTDPRGRMEQLRRRIAARASTPADDAESQRRGTKRTMGDMPGEEQRRDAPPQPGGRPMPAAWWDRGPGDSHGQQGPRLHDPRADDPGPGELGHRCRHHGRGPRTDEEPAVRPPRDGGGRGMAHPESP